MLRERKSTVSKSSSSRRVAARKTSNGKARVASSKKSNSHHKLQSALKKAHIDKRDLQRKITELNAQWKNKLKQIEEEAVSKARALFERESTRRDEARKKAVDTAIAKFEKQYSRKQTKGTSRTRSKASSSKRRTASTRSAKRRSA